MSFKLNWPKPAPTEAPLSHRKHCSWNASSPSSPLIMLFCESCISHKLCPEASKNSVNHSCSVVISGVGSDMCELTNQRLCIQEGGLKETREQKKTKKNRAFKTEMQRMEKLVRFLSIKVCKSILVVTWNKIMNLKMSRIRPPPPPPPPFSEARQHI